MCLLHGNEEIMYEDEAIKNKKDIVLDLSDTEATAKICKALSSETRLEILKCLVDKCNVLPLLVP